LQRQPDGKLLVACYTYCGEALPAVVRLNPDGSPDPSFHAPIAATEDPRTLALQADGRVLVGFRIDGGASRLNPDGALDATFQAEVQDVCALAVQPDGQIVIGGTFRYVNGVPRAGLARLNRGPVACRLSAEAPTPEGYFPMNLTGAPGARYEVLASPDLITWTPLLWVTNTTGQTRIQDTSATNLIRRFYRARQSE
jgi:uncharacterized delta-60 repeat protein